MTTAEILAEPLASAPQLPTSQTSLWSQRLPLALAVLALFGWLVWSVSARQGLLLLVGVGLGWGLAAARFGCA